MILPRGVAAPDDASGSLHTACATRVPSHPREPSVMFLKQNAMQRRAAADAARNFGAICGPFCERCVLRRRYTVVHDCRLDDSFRRAQRHIPGSPRALTHRRFA